MATAPLFDVAVGDTTLSWRPVPGTELIAIDAPAGLLLVTLEPPEPWVDPPSAWAVALANSIELPG